MFYVNGRLHKTIPNNPITKEGIEKSTKYAHPNVKELLHEFTTRDNKQAVAEFWPATGDWTVTIED